MAEALEINPTSESEKWRRSWYGDESRTWSAQAALVDCHRGVLALAEDSIERIGEAERDADEPDPIITVARDDAVAGMQEARSATEELRIALIGRTMAGKSTLFEYLARGDGSRIGVGAQRTTRDTMASAIPDIPGCVLIDTPGVGAKDGEADRRLAFEIALTCDLVLWVCANDSTQEETANALRELARQGKPIIVFMNCRERIDESWQRNRLVTRPELLWRGIDGHWSRLRSFLYPSGVVPVAECSGHALAAFRGHSNGDPELLEVSRIDQLIAALRSEVAIGPQRRAIALADLVRGPLQESNEDLTAGARQDLAEAQIARREAVEVEARLSRVIDEAEGTARNHIRRLVDVLRTWYTRVDLGSDVVYEWTVELKRLREEVKALAARLDSELHTGFAEELDAIVDDWSLPDQANETEVRNASTSGAANRLTKAVARAGPGTAAVVTLALLSNPGGWTIAGVLGGSALVSVVLNKYAVKDGGWIDRFIPGRKAKREAFRRQLAEQTRADLDEMQKQFLDHWAARLNHYRSETDRMATKLNVVGESREARSSHRTRLTEKLEATVRDLDVLLARTRLRLEGRDRAATAVSSAVRVPGIGLAVGVPEPHFSEMSLFPLHTRTGYLLPFRESPSSRWRSAADIVFGGATPPFAVRAKSEICQLSVSSPRFGFSIAGLERLAQQSSDYRVSVQQEE